MPLCQGTFCTLADRWTRLFFGNVEPQPDMPAIAAAQIPETNGLLAVLPAAERERLYPNLQPVSMALGDVVYESGSRQDYVYFPTTSIVSLLYVMADGSSAEIAVVGNEGMVGCCPLHGR